MFQITLHDARILNGYTVEEAARNIGISTDTYGTYENYPEMIPKIIAYKIKKLYDIPLDLIYLRSYN